MRTYIAAIGRALTAPHFEPTVTLGKLLVVMAVALPMAGHAQSSSAVAQALRQLSAGFVVERSINLKEIGLVDGLVFAGEDVRKEIFFPVPLNLRLEDVAIQMDGNYFRGDGGRTTLLLSRDGAPVATRSFTTETGELSIRLNIGDVQETSGFSRLGVQWTSQVPVPQCTESKADANVVRIFPASKLSYRFNGSQVKDLSTAWSTLPRMVSVWVAGSKLESSSFETALRLGLVIEGSGRRVTVSPLPRVGDAIDRSSLTVPPGLRLVPAYAALAGTGPYTLKEPAEVGALLTLPSSRFQGGVVVVDQAITEIFTTALDALEAQVRGQGGAAPSAFSELRNQVWGGTADSLKTGEVRLGVLFGQPGILVSPDASKRAARLFTAPWQRVLASANIVANDSAKPDRNTNALALAALGASPGSFDVRARGEWVASFDLGAVAAGNRLPTEFAIDVSAAPNPSSSPPVASVYVNDVLVGARRLDADGKPERISGVIPRYLLAANNTLRVTFQRQPSGDPCREKPQALPVAVLASSHLVLSQSAPAETFAGMSARFADGVQLVVSEAYLLNAINTLPLVIRMSAATGISEQQLKFSTSGSAFEPSLPFLAMDLPRQNTKDAIVQQRVGQLVFTKSEKRLLDLDGLDGVGIAEVRQIGGQTGLVYRTVGTRMPNMNAPFRLSQGDVAVVADTGPLIEVNAKDPDGAHALGAAQESWLFRLSRWPVLGSSLALILLLLAAALRRKRTPDVDC